MKGAIILIYLLICFGCTSSAVMLQTDDPESTEYWVIFGKKIVESKGAENHKQLKRLYRNKLNAIFKKDRNTSSCSIIEGSVSFGEPGSQGSATASCNQKIDLLTKKGTYTASGGSWYMYTLSEN